MATSYDPIDSSVETISYFLTNIYHSVSAQGGTISTVQANITTLHNQISTINTNLNNINATLEALVAKVNQISN